MIMNYSFNNCFFIQLLWNQFFIYWVRVNNACHKQRTTRKWRGSVQEIRSIRYSTVTSTHFVSFTCYLYVVIILWSILKKITPVLVKQVSVYKRSSSVLTINVLFSRLYYLPLFPLIYFNYGVFKISEHFITRLYVISPTVLILVLTVVNS